MMDLIAIIEIIERPKLHNINNWETKNTIKPSAYRFCTIITSITHKRWIGWLQILKQLWKIMYFDVITKLNKFSKDMSVGDYQNKTSTNIGIKRTQAKCQIQ